MLKWWQQYVSGLVYGFYHLLSQGWQTTETALGQLFFFFPTFGLSYRFRSVCVLHKHTWDVLLHTQYLVAVAH
jgi:hypothetical protein